MKNVM